jgi:hypothetical protein
MRLRAIPILAVVVASIAVLGAWTERPHVTLTDAPSVVKAEKPWSAVVRITRRGRRLDGFRPVFEVTDSEGTMHRATAKEIGPGTYRISLVFPSSGFYSYKVVVGPDAPGPHGTIYAEPR